MPGVGVRLPLVEVAAQADVAVGQREDGLGDAKDSMSSDDSRTIHGSTVNASRSDPSVPFQRSPRSATTTSAHARGARRPARAGPRRRRGRARPPSLPRAGEGVFDATACCLRHVEVRRGGEERAAARACRRSRCFTTTPSTRWSIRSASRRPAAPPRRSPTSDDGEVGPAPASARRPGRARARVDVDAVGPDLHVDDFVLRSPGRRSSRRQARPSAPPPAASIPEARKAQGARPGAACRQHQGRSQYLTSNSSNRSPARSACARRSGRRLLPRRRMHAGGLGAPRRGRRAAGSPSGRPSMSRNLPNYRFPACCAPCGS